MIYLDNAGTTKVSANVIDAMLPFFGEIYGNASSLNEYGQIAKEYLEKSRERVAELLGAKPQEIYFTSGGSESDNWAIESACRFGAIKGKMHVITSSIEHHAILHTLKEKEKQGFRITYLPVYDDGIVKVKDLEEAIQEDTCLVTIMFANNEIGTIQPIEEIGKICRAKKVTFHTDAVQAVGHVDVDVNRLNVDMLSISAHKFHGPKGVGALYCRTATPLFPFINGGAQERNRRAGTENISGIVGFSKALEEAVLAMKEVQEKELKLRNKLFSELSEIPCSRINGDIKNRLTNNFNMSFEGVEGESLLLLLSDKGVCASSGSACTSGSLDPSHVLLAIGIPHETAHGSLRLTLSKYTTEEEIDYTIKSVKEVVEYLRSISPIWKTIEAKHKKKI